MIKKLQQRTIFPLLYQIFLRKLSVIDHEGKRRVDRLLENIKRMRTTNEWEKGDGKNQNVQEGSSNNEVNLIVSSMKSIKLNVSLGIEGSQFFSMLVFSD